MLLLELAVMLHDKHFLCFSLLKYMREVHGLRSCLCLVALGLRGPREMCP